MHFISEIKALEPPGWVSAMTFHLVWKSNPSSVCCRELLLTRGELWITVCRCISCGAPHSLLLNELCACGSLPFGRTSSLLPFPEKVWPIFPTQLTCPLPPRRPPTFYQHGPAAWNLGTLSFTTERGRLYCGSLSSWSDFPVTRRNLWGWWDACLLPRSPLIRLPRAWNVTIPTDLSGIQGHTMYFPGILRRSYIWPCPWNKTLQS